MIKLFSVNDTVFNSNGDLIIKPIRAVIHKEDNGSYYLDLETPLEYINDLTSMRILVANSPNGDQAFRISNVETNQNKIKIRAYHITADSKNYLIRDSYVLDKDCNYAINHLNDATDITSPFTVSSDIATSASFRCIRKSLYEAWQTIIEKWGGHIVRDNWNVAINNSIGSDNNVTVRYAKNIESIKADYNWSNVVTKLMPVGKDGLLLPNYYLTSGTQYDIPFTKTVSFSQSDIVREDYTSDAEYEAALLLDLESQGNNYLNSNSVPKVNYTLSANIEKITDIGDTIEVIDERLGINVFTHVISYDYDCILKQYNKIEFGNFQETLGNLIPSITSSTNQTIAENSNIIEAHLSQELQNATSEIWGVLGSSYVIVEGDKILVVDSLPKETATNCIMINSGGIGFSNTGINGTFTSAWDITNTLNMANINVIGLSASMITSGTLVLGNKQNQSGQLEVYDEANTLIAELNKDGLKMYGQDGSYIVINNQVGFAGYDSNDNKIYWVDGDSFHQKKAVVEDDITLVDKMRIIPITLYNSNDEIVSDGIGFVSTN